MQGRRYWHLLIGACLLITIAACGGTGGSGDTTEATTSGDTGDARGSEEVIVTLRHSWIPDDLVLPYAMAKAQGYYEEEGINLVDQPGNGGATAAVLVANGDVMIGTGEASHVISARAEGLPIVSVMQQLQLQPSAVIAFKDSGIQDWDDLVGKKVGGTAASSASLAFEMSLDLQGINPDDVEFVSLSPGANFAALQEGQIDAALTFVGNIASLEYADDLNVLTFADAGFVTPSTAAFVNEEFLAENPEVIAGFVRATLRGLLDTLADPTAAAEALASQYANIDVEDTAAKWELNKQFVVTDVTDEHGFGWHDLEAWDYLSTTLEEKGQIEKPVPAEEAFTNEFVEAIPIEERR